ncbi:uncharacterized protein LOC134194317 [Corticium candelabrum]|uniref:uncharacterized protein LOC134194317 n=1 Tax=Corticium candelabrum TaxID=121492 RepID=UPI002E277467|nr:uncharacterized protein LOC134194317 [Corticium candelabrum]
MAENERHLTASVVEAHTLQNPVASSSWCLRRYLSSLQSCRPEEMDTQTVDEIRSVLMTEVEDDDELFFSVSQQDLFFRLSEELRKCFMTRYRKQERDGDISANKDGIVSIRVFAASANSSEKKSTSSLESPRPTPEGVSYTETAKDDRGDNLDQFPSLPSLSSQIALEANADMYTLTKEEKYLLLSLLTDHPKQPPPPYPGHAPAKAKPAKPRRTLASCLFSIDGGSGGANHTHTTERHHMVTQSRECCRPCDKDTGRVDSHQYCNTSQQQNTSRLKASLQTKHCRENRVKFTNLDQRESSKPGDCCVVHGKDHRRIVQWKDHFEIEKRQKKEEKRQHRDYKMKRDECGHCMVCTKPDTARKERRTQEEVKKSSNSRKHVCQRTTMKNYGII